MIEPNVPMPSFAAAASALRAFRSAVRALSSAYPKWVAGSENDRNSPAVGAPRRAGHIARARGAEERDNGGDFLGFREAAERAAGGDLREHLVPLALLVGESAFAEP